MAVTGNVKQSTEWAKSYGLAAYEVLGCNLTFKELKELGFYVKEEDLDSAREFIGERDGNATVQIEFACRSVGPNSKLKRFSFWLEDKNDRNAEDSAKGDLYKFINAQGTVAWSKKPNIFVPLNPEYAEYFTGKDGVYHPRPAKKGEEQLMDFMRNCMAVDWKSGGTLSYDVKKMFYGNFKEINSDLETEYKTTILVATTIKVKESDEGIKEVESFYSYKFAPGSYFKNVLNKKEYTAEDVARIHKKIENNVGKKGKEKEYVTPLEQLIAKMTDEKYPCKDIFYLGLVKDYVSGEHPETSNEAIVHGDTEPVEQANEDSSMY